MRRTGTVGRRGPPSARPRRHKDNRRKNGNSNHNHHLIGSTVSVVQKQDQPTGRLTTGIVGEILTNADFHPRGIKVRLTDGTVGRIATESSGSPSNSGGGGEEPSRAYSTATTYPDGGRRENATLADFLPTSSAAARAPISFDAATEDWTCEACTFKNSGLLPTCEVCETSRTA